MVPGRQKHADLLHRSSCKPLVEIIWSTKKQCAFCGPSDLLVVCQRRRFRATRERKVQTMRKECERHVKGVCVCVSLLLALAELVENPNAYLRYPDPVPHRTLICCPPCSLCSSSPLSLHPFQHLSISPSLSSPSPSPPPSWATIYHEQIWQSSALPALF